jgi:DNA modification methylase
MLTPYYQESGITIYHADCRAVLPLLPSVDLVLTDPPYGIGEAAGKNKNRSALAKSADYGNESWDDAPAPQWLIDWVRQLARQSIIWGGNYYTLPPTSCWLVWDKDNGENDFADCELAWTTLPSAVRRLKWTWHGMIQENMARKEPRVYPTQKPIALMKWCIGLAGAVETILDPFMGSGSTLRAAKDLGKQAIGIDRREQACEIAANRLRQEVLAFA